MPGPESWSSAQAAAFAHKYFGLQAAASQLPSYDDRNFLLTNARGERFVLKLDLRDPYEQHVDLQNRVIGLLKGLPVPEVFPTRSGEPFVSLPEGGIARLLSFLPGTMMGQVLHLPMALLEDLGELLGSVDRRLEGFSHPAMHRHLYWDLKHAGQVIRKNMDALPDGAVRRIVADILAEFEGKVAPRLGSLPSQVIFGDGNEQNVLVQGGKISGLLDFGDVVFAPRVFEPAIAGAYAMLNKADPLEASAAVVKGYQRANPLGDGEIAMLYALMRTRLAVSVCVAAGRDNTGLAEDYHHVSADPAMDLLTDLQAVSPNFALALFRSACGLAPSLAGERLAGWLKKQAGRFSRIIHLSPAVSVDLRVGSPHFPRLDQLTEPEALGQRIFDGLKKRGAKLGVGGYGETRLVYTGDMFSVPRNEGRERRTVHIGTDLWAPAGTPVHAPLPGRVHAFADNAGHQDYGPTIILAHEMPGQPGTDGEPDRFYTLYGHLSHDSLEGLETGKEILGMQEFARIGVPAVNGGWPPHLHFQVISDLLGNTTEFPGVALPSQRDLWMSVCPDPNLILGLPGAEAVPVPGVGQLLEQRRRRLGYNLSVSYQEPLHIVRGWRQFLFDAAGQPYLDCSNNVCHVGHSHPAVVEALAGQAAVLNTNTRYLHEHVLQLSERLAAKMPAGGISPLSVCFFVNSGSEANDLALRLARAFTGRRDMLVLEGAYHGNLISNIHLSPYKHAGPGGSGPPNWVHPLSLPCSYRGKLRHTADPGAGYARMARETIAALEAEGRGLAGFISEAIIGTGGQVVFPEGYLEKVYALVRQAGGVCIADEVQHGFGRLGSHYWGFESHGVLPDIVTVGKPFGNGHPLAAVITRPEIAAAFDNGMEYFNTFGGSPVSASAGLAVMDVIENEGLQSRAERLGNLWKAALAALAGRYPVIGDVRGSGLFLGIELVRDRETLAPAAAEAAFVVNFLRRRGILLSTDGPLHNIIKIKPPMVIQEVDILRVVEELDSAFQALGQPALFQG